MRVKIADSHVCQIESAFPLEAEMDAGSLMAHPARFPALSGLHQFVRPQGDPDRDTCAIKLPASISTHHRPNPSVVSQFEISPLRRAAGRHVVRGRGRHRDQEGVARSQTAREGPAARPRSAYQAAGAVPS